MVSFRSKRIHRPRGCHTVGRSSAEPPPKDRKCGSPGGSYSDHRVGEIWQATNSLCAYSSASPGQINCRLKIFPSGPITSPLARHQPHPRYHPAVPGLFREPHQPRTTSPQKSRAEKSGALIAGFSGASRRIPRPETAFSTNPYGIQCNCCDRG